MIRKLGLAVAVGAVIPAGLSLTSALPAEAAPERPAISPTGPTRGPVNSGTEVAFQDTWFLNRSAADSPYTKPLNLGSTVGAGSEFSEGQYLASPNGKYNLVMQSDGNLVLYQAGTALWASNTGGPGRRVVMQDDGNLVIYSGSTAVWSTSTGGFGASELILQDDANVVIYREGVATWSRFGGYVGNELVPGTTLAPGEVRKSPNQRYTLAMQTDGNLVMRDETTHESVWASSTVGPNRRAIMRADGNLGVYQGSDAKWSSETVGNDGALLLVQDDGNLAIYRGGTAVWTRNGSTGGVRGDDYPAGLKNAAKDALVDPWTFYNRECTSFVAWRLNSVNGANFTNVMSGPNGQSGRFGNADNWGPNARIIGYRVDNTPAVGSVAWWNSTHVAWVAQVNSNGTIVIEEYNHGGDGNYNRRTISASSVTGFIHIRDV